MTAVPERPFDTVGIAGVLAAAAFSAALALLLPVTAWDLRFLDGLFGLKRGQGAAPVAERASTCRPPRPFPSP
jgi:hypothetical protein